MANPKDVKGGGSSAKRAQQKPKGRGPKVTELSPSGQEREVKDANQKFRKRLKNC